MLGRAYRKEAIQFRPIAAVAGTNLPVQQHKSLVLNGISRASKRGQDDCRNQNEDLKGVPEKNDPQTHLRFDMKKKDAIP